MGRGLLHLWHNLWIQIDAVASHAHIWLRALALHWRGCLSHEIRRYIKLGLRRQDKLLWHLHLWCDDGRMVGASKSRWCFNKASQIVAAIQELVCVHKSLLTAYRVGALPLEHQVCLLQAITGRRLAGLHCCRWFRLLFNNLFLRQNCFERGRRYCGYSCRCGPNCHTSCRSHGVTICDSLSLQLLRITVAEGCLYKVGG